MTDLHIWLTVAVIAAITALLRFLPFAVFSGKRSVPAFVRRLSGILPAAVMGMLVVYCLREVHFSAPAGFVPALLSSLLVGLLYVWKRNTLLSILGGTVCYMILVQAVF